MVDYILARTIGRATVPYGFRQECAPTGTTPQISFTDEEITELLERCARLMPEIKKEPEFDPVYTVK